MHLANSYTVELKMNYKNKYIEPYTSSTQALANTKKYCKYLESQLN